MKTDPATNPAIRALSSSFGGGWVWGLTDEARATLRGYFGEEPGEIPCAAVAGWIVEPADARDLAEHLQALDIKWKVES